MLKHPVHFVIAAPHSGARRLMTILNRHSAIFASEHQLFGDYFNARPVSPNARPPRITFDRYARSFANHYQFRAINQDRREFVNSMVDEFASFVYEFSARHSQRSHIIDVVIPFQGTSPLAIASVLKRFPESKIISLVRDGRDVVTAATLNAIPFDGYGTDRHAFFLENRPGVSLKRFLDDQMLREWSHHWAETVQQQQLDSPRVLQVNYASLAANPKQYLDEIANHLELPSTFTEEQLNFGEAGLIERVMLRTGPNETALPITDQWKDLFTTEDGKIFDEIAGTDLVKLGFESDPHWVEQLPQKLEFVSQ